MANELEDYLEGGKTPISYLQELCNKRGVTPQYDLVANEGAVHEPLFVFKVTAGEYIGTGKGPSKKKAKHNAAVCVLGQMVGTPSVPTDNQAKSDSLKADDGDDFAGNPVGELQEMSQKKLWPPPTYDFTSEQGPPHAREFICTVRLFNLVEQAVGKSKKLAKRNAAIAMLQIVRQGVAVPTIVDDLLDDCDDDNILLSNPEIEDGSQRVHENGVRQASGVEAVERKKLSAMFQSGKIRCGKVLDSLQKLSLDDDKSEQFGYCNTLRELADEQHFAVNYVDILSKSGQYYHCLVELTTVPTTVDHGTADSLEGAHSVAARNILNSCKILTRKSS